MTSFITLASESVTRDKATPALWPRAVLHRSVYREQWRHSTSFYQSNCIYNHTHRRIYIYERERERIADINTDLYDFHLLFFLSLYLNIAISTTPFFFLKKMDTISGLRYRAEEAMRAVSRHAVRTARRKEIEEEIINSEKLKVYS